MWYLLEVCVTRQIQELAGSLLFDLGTTGIVILGETPETVKLGAYFDHEAKPELISQAIKSTLAQSGCLSGLLGLDVSTVADQDWLQKWKEGFEQIEIGNRLAVAPSWKRPGVRAGRATIRIDPGMAFGTGTHETTRLCLEEIEQRWHGGSFLDVGTGTGILAIAAAVLAPASRVLAIDVDPVAVEVARENAAINRVSNSVEVLQGQARDFAERAFDMVIANLTADAIIDLLPDLARLLRESGCVVLSGILSEFSCEVERAAAQAGLAVAGRRHSGEWTALVAIKTLPNACTEDHR